MINSITEFELYCEAHGSFTQSSLWGKVKDKWETNYIISKDSQGNIQGIMLLLIKRVPMTKLTFFYAPRGPVCNTKDINILKDILDKVKVLAREHNAFMLKIDPMIDTDDILSQTNFIKLGFIYRNKVGYDNIQTRENYLLPLKNKSADEIFASFKPKCRYNIRKAEKSGVKCILCKEEKIDDFMMLMKETSSRNEFSSRKRNYFINFIKSFNVKAGLCMCYLDGQALSGALWVNYAGVTSYVYGCSSEKNREFMPNYLMQWTMIKKAIESGCHTYDFMGIPYWYDNSHKNYGVYKFKSGFCGEIKTYAGEFDYVFSPFVCHLFNSALRIKKYLLKKFNFFKYKIKKHRRCS